MDSGSRSHKACVYFAGEVLDEVRSESIRLDRSLSWVVQKAWLIARAQIQQCPVAPTLAPDREPACARSVSPTEANGPRSPPLPTRVR